jgi:HSP20 family protein
METLGLTGANRPAVPAIDVIELSETVVVQIDLPGVSAEAVDLSLTGNTLTLVAGRIRPDFPPDARFHVRERMVGKYQRSISLPASVDDGEIHAETRDGLLTVTLRKSAPAAGRSIPVTRGAASHFPQ